MARSPITMTTHWNDSHIPMSDHSVTRHCLLELQASPTATSSPIPLNLGLVLDCSRSMQGEPMEALRQAVQRMVQALRPGDHLSVIRFNHMAEVLYPNQAIRANQPPEIDWATLTANGGTAIDQGLRLGLDELVKHRYGKVSGLLLFTDGENEHGDMEQCFQLGRQALRHNVTIHAVGLGAHWSHPLLEYLADLSGGCLIHQDQPAMLSGAFQEILGRMQNVGLVNTTLWIQPEPTIRLVSQFPITQVTPEVVNLIPQPSSPWVKVRLGDLLALHPRQLLLSIVVDPLPLGRHPLLQFKVSYERPDTAELQFTDPEVVSIEVTAHATPQPQTSVEQAYLKVEQYRHTQVAQGYLHQHDCDRTLEHLQQAAKTATYLGNDLLVDALTTAITQLENQGEISPQLQRKAYFLSRTEPKSPDEGAKL